jgi:putative nucleotidyltransferase with HDIG domain
MTAPPRLIVRTMAVTFVTVAVILTVVFVVLTLDTRQRVRSDEIQKLAVSEAVFRKFEERRRQDQLGLVATLAEHPTLKAALLTYVTDRQFGSAPEIEAQQRQTVVGEAAKLAVATDTDVIAVLDREGRVVAGAGAASEVWTPGAAVDIPVASPSNFQRIVVVNGIAFLVSGAPLRLQDPNLGDLSFGTLVLGTSLDDNYAGELSDLAGTGIIVTLHDTVMARTVPEDVARALLAQARETADINQLNGEEYAVGVMMSSDEAKIYALSSIDDATQAATRDALAALAAIAFGSIVLAALGSLWLARTLTEPIDRLSSEIATMTAARAFGSTLEPTGTSRELDALATAFNDLMRGLTAAEAETQAAYFGAIRGLAAALDARDPYTAGHSERVSALSVLTARHMKLPEADVDVIRLGALLHDIGKIGVTDEVLRKPGALTAEEYEQIKRHPALGAHILRQVPFLAAHLPIVELHHERPDGRGYPFGLRGDAIPLAARIVHVADAFDAMTSARAYRPARGPSFAVEELQRGSGAEFDPASVEALCAALPTATSASEPQLQQLLGRAV